MLRKKHSNKHIFSFYLRASLWLAFRASSFGVVFLAVFLLFAGGCTAPSQPPPEESINYLLSGGDLKIVVDGLAEPLVDKCGFVGMAIGIVTPERQLILTYGVKSKETKYPIKEDTFFQIGSVSKAFTSLLLVELENEGIISPQTEVGDLLPDGIEFKSKSLREIKLEKLASHSSGLSQDAMTLRMLWLASRYAFTGSNIYEGLTPDDLLGYLSETEIDPEKDYKYCYSNIGYSFLGCLLAKTDKQGYRHLLGEKVLRPLGLKNTMFVVPQDQSWRIALGYSGELPPLLPRGIHVEPWEMNGNLAAAGGLYSTLEDMMLFLKENMGLVKTPLYEPMRKTHKKRIEANGGKFMGLGWFIQRLPASGAEVTYVDGLIGGNTSFVGFDPESGVGVVVLQNSCNMDDRISLTLLDRIIGAVKKKKQL